MPERRCEPWFADEGGLYSGSEPFFYDPGQFAWTGRLCDGWTVVRDELGLSGATKDFQPYMDADMASRPDRWRTFGLMFWGVRSSRNIALLPRTWSLVRDIPGLVACSLNLLEPKTSIKPHVGNTDAIMRCHLGLAIPDAAPRCGFRVGSETRSWSNGELLMFCDAHEHTAWNNTDQARYVMVIDVMRDEFLSRTREICTRVRSEIRLNADLKTVPWVRALCGVRGGVGAARALYRCETRYRLAVGE